MKKQAPFYHFVFLWYPSIHIKPLLNISTHVLLLENKSQFCFTSLKTCPLGHSTTPLAPIVLCWRPCLTLTGCATSRHSSSTQRNSELQRRQGVRLPEMQSDWMTQPNHISINKRNYDITIMYYIKDIVIVVKHKIIDRKNSMMLFQLMKIWKLSNFFNHNEHVPRQFFYHSYNYTNSIINIYLVCYLWYNFSVPSSLSSFHWWPSTMPTRARRRRCTWRPRPSTFIKLKIQTILYI
jgi:hypothetical protein